MDPGSKKRVLWLRETAWTDQSDDGQLRDVQIPRPHGVVMSGEVIQETESTFYRVCVLGGGAERLPSP